MPKNFPCTSCGLCCRLVVNVIPELAKEDGSCIHLDDENQCKIYDSRPEVCRVSFAIHRKRVDSGEDNFSCNTEEEYFKANADVCNQLQKQVGLGEEYRVKI